MYCSNCGTKLEENVTICPECGTEIVKSEQESKPETEHKKTENIVSSITNIKDKIVKTSKKLSPIVAVDLALTIIAFLTGFIITTTSFAVGWGVAYLDFFTILPAFVGLGIGIYKAFDEKSEKNEKSASKACIILNSFTLFYAFIGIMVAITG